MRYLAYWIFGWIAAATVYGGTFLEFESEIRTTVEADEEESIEVSTDGITVYLGYEIIETVTGTGVLVRDFKEKKVFRSNDQQTEYDVYSLYADIGFRVIEFRNRSELGGVLSKAGIEENPMETVLNEHLFSLDSGETPNLERNEEAGEVTYSYEGKPLLRYSLDGEVIDEETQERYNLFLRYEFGIHPKILSELSTTNRVPETLVVYQYHLGEEEVTLHLVSRKEVAGIPQRDFSQRIPLPEEPLFQISARASAMSEEDFANGCIALKLRAVEQAEAGQLLDSASLFMAYILATGEQLPPEFFEYKEAMQSDEEVQLLFASINPRSKEAAEKSVEVLADLEGRVRQGNESILIFQANILDSLGKRQEAIDLFLEALELNPIIVGAWKDLGELYYRSFDSRRAWLCWDTGRSLYGEHAMFEQIDYFEEDLFLEHPEFFLRFPKE
tara:strand:+ start:4669 stop:6000 length:1332 start_codon:yes stop_codon:yes gene_type:complete